MCNLLVRGKKPFVIEAGHWKNSNVLERVVKRVRSGTDSFRLCSAVGLDKSAKLLPAWRFLRAADVLKRKLGIRTVPCDCRILEPNMQIYSEREVDAEIKNNKLQFAVRRGIEQAHQRSARVGLAVRRWIKDEKLTGFTVNFLDVNRAAVYRLCLSWRPVGHGPRIVMRAKATF